MLVMMNVHWRERRKWVERRLRLLKVAERRIDYEGDRVGQKAFASALRAAIGEQTS
jgi:hypothetical protein